MAIIKGPQATRGPRAELESRIPIEIGDEVIFQAAHLNALVYLCRKNKMTVKQPTFRVMEDKPLEPSVTVKTAATASGTSIVLTAGHGARVRASSDAPHAWINEATGEILLVKSVATDTLTVIRGYGTTSAAAIAAASTLTRLGSALHESAKAGPSQQTKVTERINYTQLFSLTTDVTETRHNTDQYGIDELERQRKNTTEQFKRDLERHFLFGQPLVDVEGATGVKDSTSGIDVRYMTGGFKHWIDTDASSNVKDASGTISWRDFGKWIGSMTAEAPSNMGNGETDLVLLCGREATAAINDWLKADVETMSGQKEFGFNVQKLVTPFGKCAIHQHHLLVGEYSDYIFAVNPKYVGVRTLQNMDIQVRNVELPNEHQIKEEIYAQCGFYLALPELHGYMKNVRAVS